ncbi:hypothetical protein quinque_001014 [Culex quinquefasciatus]
MTTLRPRENTFKVDLSVFPKRPSFEEIHSFVHDTMGLRIDQVKRLQMNHVQNAAHVKCDTLKTAQDAVDQHNERHEIEMNKVKYKVRLQMDDASVEVKVHDLSENVRNEEITAFLRQYGEMEAEDDPIVTDQCTEQTPKDGQPEMMFKVPALPLPTNDVQCGISETDESSSDGSGFQGVKPKNPRGRPKKSKT